MKRMQVIITILTLASMSLSTSSQSQTRFGVRGGLNLTTINEDLGGTETIDFEGSRLPVTLNQSRRTTFGAGGFVEFWLSPMFALQINTLYNQKGFVIKGDVNTRIVQQGIPINIKVQAEQTLKLTYLSFPVLAKLAFGENVKPYIVAGPEFGVLLSGKRNDKATSEGEAMGTRVGPFSVEQEQDVKESLETIELAVNVGAGFAIPLGSVEIFVDAQYSLGLTKINKETSLGEPDIRNQGIMINLGLSFGVN